MERSTLLSSGVVMALCLLGLFIQTGESIRCWDCNSKFDPRCAHGHFDNHTLDTVDCNQKKQSHLANYEAKYCRKVVQYVEGTLRTVRGCGWLPDSKAKERGGCYSRTGTKDIMVIFCSCDHDSCNSGPRSQERPAATALLGAALLAITITRF